MRSLRTRVGRLCGVLWILVVGSGCTVLRVDLPRAVTEADWLTEGDGPGRTHAADLDLDPPLEVAWTYDAGGGFGPVSPLLLRDAVLVATRHGEVHGIILETGKKIGTQGFGDAIEGSPAVEQGYLFVPVAAGDKVLRAYDLAQSREAWAFRNGAPLVAGVLTLGGRVFVADVDGQVMALDARTGEEVWRYRLRERPEAVLATPVAVANDRIVLAGADGDVVCLNATDGVPVWRVALGVPVEVTPTAGEGRVYLATTRGRLLALEAASGTIRWTFALPDTTVRLAAPALAGQDLVFGASDGFLRMLDARTGSLRWTYPAGDAITAPPLITRSTVYVGTMGRKLVGVDRGTGALRWEQVLKGRVKSPMAARDGVLVVLTEPKTVYAFIPEPPPVAGTR